MRMCTVATTPPFDMRIDAMKVTAAVLTASNCRETVSLFANYTGVSMETVETPLDPPLYKVCKWLKLSIPCSIQRYHGSSMT